MKVVGKTTTTHFTFESFEKIRFGEYVIAKNVDGRDVLGIIKNVVADVEKFVGEVKVIGVLDGSKIIPNRTPILPNSEVRLCDDETLNNIYLTPNGLNIGHLLTRDNVRVYLDTNKLVSRHFAILSITGGGKSNTVSVLCRELAKKNGTVIMIDPHGEYISLYHEDMEGKIKVIDPIINPVLLAPSEFANLIGVEDSEMEKRVYVEFAYHTVKHEYPNAKGIEFIEKIENLLYEWSKIASVGWEIKYYNPLRRNYDRRKLEKEDFVILMSLIDTISKFKLDYALNIGDKDVIEEFEIGKINIVNLSGLEIPQMVTFVGFIAKHLLLKRITYLKSLKDVYSINDEIRRVAQSNLNIIESHYKVVTKPVLLIVEEAHIFIPVNEQNSASLWLGKIAREGRKFGVGLGLVSQRPKQLHPDVLSQTNTKIILKIVEPEDQKYIQRASEELGEDLAKDLASLGIGEAIIVGNAISLPSIVKIDKFDGVYGGKDINIVGEWMGLDDEW